MKSPNRWPELTGDELAFEKTRVAQRYMAGERKG